jgi:hypothetical protein
LFNPNGALVAEAREAFDQATTLYDSGNFAEAAAEFSHLAQVAQSLGRPRRVIQLHLRAFDAWINAKNGDQALAEARAALDIANRRPRKAARMAEALIADLQANGFTAQANALAGNAGLPTPTVAEAQKEAAAPQKHGTFPSTCPQCGGRLPRSFGEDEIECDYCGTVIRAQ